jgi:putative transposase
VASRYWARAVYFSEMLQAMVNASLDGEMEHFMKEASDGEADNRRNGHTEKSVRSTAGPLKIRTPRDRAGAFKPILIEKRQRELPSGLDEVILSLYARGQSVEDVQAQLRKIYGLELSTGQISTITERVWEEALRWQQRPLEACYAIIYLDGIHFRVQTEGRFDGKVILTVYGVNVNGERDVLGLYVYDTESSSNWSMVLEDLKQRGVENVLFFCVDGLKGFPQAVEGAFPKAILQRCIVHMVRTSARFVSDKDLKKVCADLRKVYTSPNELQAKLALEEFDRKWGKKYKYIRPQWEENWKELMAFMAFTQNIRRMIYTTNPVEALHRVMRKVTKAKGAWVSERALLKQLYLALQHNEKSWKRKARGWKSIQMELAEKFGEDFTRYLEK